MKVSNDNNVSCEDYYRQKRETLIKVFETQPTPLQVGLLTRISLLENVIMAYKKKEKE